MHARGMASPVVHHDVVSLKLFLPHPDLLKEVGGELLTRTVAEVPRNVATVAQPAPFVVALAACDAVVDELRSGHLLVSSNKVLVGEPVT